MSDTATRIDSSEELAARSGIYHLLARIWLHEVTPDFLQQLRTSELSESFVAAGGILPSGDDSAVIERLAIDYCRLFVGPKNHLPPYQSVWQSGQFQTATSTSMKQYIEVIGYDIGRLPPGTMLDHLGVQLDVMGHLLGQLSAWSTESPALSQALELADAFLKTQLAWPSELLLAAEARATTDFYRSSIAMTAELLQSENSTADC